MKVIVKLFGEFRAVAGGERFELDLPESVSCGEALRWLARREPSLERLLFVGDMLRDHLHVFVNGRNVAHLHGLSTPLSDGDALTFFPPISGG